MDLDQLVKKLDWLDQERRKDKTTLTMLEDRLITLEGGYPTMQQGLKGLSGELTRLSSTLSHFDQIDSSLANLRVEIAKGLEAVEKTRTEHDREIEKVRRADQETLNKAISEVRKSAEPIGEIKKNLQARIDEEYRLVRMIEEVKKSFTEIQRSDEEYRRAIRVMEEGNRQDSKRLTDLQGEVTAMRKRIDEQRGKLDVTSDSVRKTEMRLNELLAAETERRQAQTSFLEKQALLQVERDRVWKEWATRFEVIERQSTNLEQQLQALDTTNRAVKRAQEGFEEITQRFERRINEITEMQRLVEDRFRQEWVSFKADDQKRWTNYSLAQDEQQREASRNYDKQNERLVALEDLTQAMQDLLHQVNEETEKRLQSLLELTHEWLDTFGNVVGRSS